VFGDKGGEFQLGYGFPIYNQSFLDYTIRKLLQLSRFNLDAGFSEYIFRNTLKYFGLYIPEDHTPSFCHLRHDGLQVFGCFRIL